MKSAIAIITYGRREVLEETLKGLNKFCPQYPTAIFEDCGQRDSTESYLIGSLNNPGKPRKDLLATEYSGAHLGRDNIQIFLGDANLGVAGNSNRALKWFKESGCDHLCLLNDDLHVLGDFVNFYANAHIDLEIGMLSFCDFTHHESYRWITVNVRGYRVKLCPRMTGIMMSFTKDVTERIGYFDARFGKFGQEHCDFMNRARFAKFLNVDGQMQTQVDVDCTPPLLKHQDVETSFKGPDRQKADQEAEQILRYVAGRYNQEPLFREYRLRIPRMAGGHAGFGIPVDNMGTYQFADVPA
jgi:glycosyltransferase involved in cell wall biosynthesis